MKARVIVLTMICAVTMSSLAACSTQKNSKESKSPFVSKIASSATQDENVQIANPWVSCKTLEEAEETAGIAFKIPENIERYAQVDVQAIKDELIQVYYQNKEKIEDDISIRKGIGADDISGDYNEYENSKEATVGTYDVTLKGNDGKFMLAIWTSDGYSYSVSTSGLEEDEILKIVEQMK